VLVFLPKRGHASSLRWPQFCDGLCDAGEADMQVDVVNTAIINRPIADESHYAANPIMRLETRPEAISGPVSPYYVPPLQHPQQSPLSVGVPQHGQQRSVMINSPFQTVLHLPPGWKVKAFPARSDGVQWSHVDW
jgi:hypothetical protein